MNERTRLHASTFAFILRNADMNISNMIQIIYMIWRFALYSCVSLKMLSLILDSRYTHAIVFSSAKASSKYVCNGKLYSHR